jgi:hypothetical protein
MHDPLQRLYRTKLALLATLLLCTGLGLLIFGHWVQHAEGFGWLSNWPILDIGSGLFTTGLLGVALQYFDGQDSETRATQRLERVLTAAAPAMRDAVIDGFAFEPNDLARVATPETLDKIISNGLAIRLGDAGFADEIYQDVRDQAIGLPERLHDARISIRFSPNDTPPQRGRVPMFVTTVHWESTLTPTYLTRRFTCLSDLQEFRDLAQGTAETSAWYIKPQPGVDAGSKDAFELVEFTVDGEPRAIRRSAKQGSQTYSVNLGRDTIEAAQPVTVAYTYRTITPVNGHLLQLRVDEPTKGLSVELDYTDCGLSYVSVLDFIASSQKATISRSPSTVPGSSVSVDFDGWVFPRSGVAFVWTTNDEAPGTAA